MNFLRILFLSISTLCCLCALALKEYTVESTYTYVVPSNISRAIGEVTALDRAKIQAIEEKFGTYVNQSTSTIITNADGETSTDFMSVGGTMLKGEWVETIGKPKYKYDHDEDGNYLITVTVKGKVRELRSKMVELDARVLCNSIDNQNDCSEFKNGDSMYLKFKTPVNGYITVYLVDYTERTVYPILPYIKDRRNALPVLHDKEYIFFKDGVKADGLKAEVNEYTLSCDYGKVRNDVYIVFSEKDYMRVPFTQADKDAIRTVPLEQFQTWLAKVQSTDETMTVVNKVLTISK